ncbi:Hypothetical protein UVM_LOCUS494 [uncultured virus]|nr:Hypothetical protein UVM_LOCUS494 [uncultured virus]
MQGKIFVVSAAVRDATVSVIVKADRVFAAMRRSWPGAPGVRLIRGEHEPSVGISDAYVDAAASLVLSQLVERGLTPHFPLVYAATLCAARMRQGAAGRASQLIWMEHLDSSARHVLAHEPRADRWWSALFQVTAALVAGLEHVGLVHNDLHDRNVRRRRVPEDSFLYYRLASGQLVAVPTFGSVYVVIDFGRVSLQPWGTDGPRVTSSAFDRNGSCRRLVPDNTNIDLVRFVLSLDEICDVVDSPSERRDLRALMRSWCTTDDGVDLIAALDDVDDGSEDDRRFFRLLDTVPRTRCHAADPRQQLQRLAAFFPCSRLPDGVVPYPLNADIP